MTIRILGIIIAGALALACSEQGPGASATPGGAGAPGGAPGDVAAAPAGAQAASCLELVRSERYVEAVAPCVEAARNAPDDREIAAALSEAQAQAEAAGEAARANAEGMGEAAQADAEASAAQAEQQARSDAADGIDDTAKGLSDSLR